MMLKKTNNMAKPVRGGMKNKIDVKGVSAKVKIKMKT